MDEGCGLRAEGGGWGVEESGFRFSNRSTAARGAPAATANFSIGELGVKG